MFDDGSSDRSAAVVEHWRDRLCAAYPETWDDRELVEPRVFDVFAKSLSLFIRGRRWLGCEF